MSKKLTTFRFVLFCLCKGITVPVSTLRYYVICVRHRRLQNRQNITWLFFLQTLINIDNQCNPCIMKKKTSVSGYLLLTLEVCKDIIKPFRNALALQLVTLSEIATHIPKNHQLTCQVRFKKNKVPPEDSLLKIMVCPGYSRVVWRHQVLLTVVIARWGKRIPRVDMQSLCRSSISILELILELILWRHLFILEEVKILIFSCTLHKICH